MKEYTQFDDWLTAAVSDIKFFYDKYEVRDELAAHLEDKALDLMRFYPDLTREAAERLALERMGDPEEIGQELAKIHKPWLGYLWAASVWAVIFGGGLLAFELIFVLKLIF